MKNIDLSRRNNLPQLMDSANTDFDTFRACLADLSKVYLTFAYRPTLRFFEHLAQSGRLPTDRTVTVVDVGSGFGGMVRKIDRWAVRRGFKLDLTGVDQNPLCARAAEEVTAPGRPIRFVTADIFAHQPPSKVDIVISSLMTHQMDDTSLIRFISWMEANAAIGWFVNDLRRNAIALSSILRDFACAPVSRICAA
jgi:trans-aconitate methyltransferase